MSDQWFADWAARAPKQAEKHLEAGTRAVEAVAGVYTIDEIDSVCEYFGGVGGQSRAIRREFSPDVHRILENHPDAVSHLRKVFGPEVDVRLADSYDPDNTFPADLVSLDFGDLTIWKTRLGQPHRQLLNRVFSAGPKAVLVTDIACRYLHLHRERYETILGAGTCDTYASYLEALGRWFRDCYGYGVQAGYYHRWSAVLTLVPRPWNPTRIQELEVRRTTT